MKYKHSEESTTSRLKRWSLNWSLRSDTLEYLKHNLRLGASIIKVRRVAVLELALRSRTVTPGGGGIGGSPLSWPGAAGEGRWFSPTFFHCLLSLLFQKKCPRCHVTLNSRIKEKWVPDIQNNEKISWSHFISLATTHPKCKQDALDSTGSLAPPVWVLFTP